MRFPRTVLVAVIAMMSAAAGAAPADDLVTGIKKCMAVTDITARHACYDALAPQVNATQTQPSSPSQPSPPEAADSRPWYDTDRIFGTSPALQTKPEQFGAEELTPPASASKPDQVARSEPPMPEAIDSISARVTSFTMNPYRRFVVFLDNGQVWKQMDSDSERAYFHKNGGDRVVISRGVLGSYRLAIIDAGTAFWVKRIH